MSELGDGWESSEPPAAGLVRPYVLTAGRTDPGVDLPLEARIGAVADAAPPSWPSADARARIVASAPATPSVAEIAAQLELPLGVARVLIGDLVTQGYLRVHATLGESASLAERRELIGRTLRGLRAL